MKTLHYDSKGQEVEKLQHLLLKYGYDVEENGTFDPSTASAVLKFQKQNELTADGIVGPETWKALTETENGNEEENAECFNDLYNEEDFEEEEIYDTVQLGSEGEDVEMLQDMLNEWGFDVDESGAFDSFTEKAVKAFQVEHGLETDGIVGPETWNVLLSVDNNQDDDDEETGFM